MILQFHWRESCVLDPTSTKWRRMKNLHYCQQTYVTTTEMFVCQPHNFNVVSCDELVKSEYVNISKDVTFFILVLLAITQDTFVKSLFEKCVHVSPRKNKSLLLEYWRHRWGLWYFLKEVTQLYSSLRNFYPRCLSANRWWNHKTDIENCQVDPWQECKWWRRQNLWGVT